MISVRRADPSDPGPRALLEQSHALMQGLFPAEENHFLSIEALRGPDIRFFAAYDDGDVIGTGALAIRTGYGEIKSMFTAEHARGRGIGAMILVRLEEEARHEGLPLLRLETGNALDAALRLYGRAGFTARGPFGDYAATPTSLFYEKVL